MESEDQAHAGVLSCPFSRAAPRSPRALQLLLQAGWFYFHVYFDPTQFSSVPSTTAQAMQHPPLHQDLHECTQAPNHPWELPLGPVCTTGVKINSS